MGGAPSVRFKGHPLTASAISAGGAFPINHHCRYCSNLFTENWYHIIVINRWKGALDTPNGKRPHSHRMGKTEGKHQKAGVVRHSRHEGLAPVRYPRLETGSGFFAGEFLPDIGSIGLSFSKRSRSPDLRAGIRGPGFPSSRSSGSAAARSGKGAQTSAIKNGASPSLPRRDRRNPKRRQKERRTT